MSMFLAAVSLLGLSSQASILEVMVRPSQLNGWTASTFSPFGKTTASWHIGSRKGVPHLGHGALWLHTGSHDGIAFAETAQYKGLRIRNLTGLAYSTFTAINLDNLAPLLSMNVDVSGDGKGDFFLLYSPEMNCQVVPRGRWTAWNTLAGRWWSSKHDPATSRTLQDWMKYLGAPDASIDVIRVQAGTWDKSGGNLGMNSWLGADLVSVHSGLEAKMFNFEPDLFGSGSPRTDTSPRRTTATPVVTMAPMLPVIIVAPTYYISVQGTIVVNNELRVAKSEEATFEATPSDWRGTEHSVFVPIHIKGNGNIGEYISDCELAKDGALKLGSVPFLFRSGKSNCWFSHHDDGTGQRTFTNDERVLSLPVNLDNVQRVYTLMNTYWGVPEQGRLLIELRFSGGKTHLVEFRGGRELREFGGDRWTKSIEKPTVQVWAKSDKRVDMQSIQVPQALQALELKEIRIVDKGADAKQRAFLAGMTLQVRTRDKYE